MRHSRLLLREAPERPIADIAHACGFASLATFYRVFSAATGLTPGKFRVQSEPCGAVDDAAQFDGEAAIHLTVK